MRLQSKLNSAGRDAALRLWIVGAVLDTTLQSPEDTVSVAVIALQEHRTENERRLCGDLISEHECAGIINILIRDGH